jgi:hypothetical protein
MSASTPQNYRVLGQAPLDAKLILKNVAAFNALRLADPAYAFNFYKGMKVYFQEEERTYIWEDPFSDNYKENDKLLLTNFIYPVGSVYEDYDYSLKAFNLIELPYNIVNLGLWNDDEELTVEVEIYEGSTVNPFVVSDILTLWPNAERIAFISGDITGLKLSGQTLQLYQEFAVSDWSNLSYTIWNTANEFVQTAKIRVIMPGEVVDYNQYIIRGNAFKEASIVHSISDMSNKNSIYFRPVTNTFEIHVIDRLNVRRVFSSQQQGITDLILSFFDTTLQLKDTQGNILTQTLVKIDNIHNLRSELDQKIQKPTQVIPLPDADYKNLVVLDDLGNSANALYSQVVQNIFQYVSDNLPSFDNVELQNEDEVIRIENLGNNEFSINSNISFFEEEFDIPSHPANTCTLAFNPTNIVGVYNDGVKLNRNQYNIILPNKIEIIAGSIDVNFVTINYFHKII